MNAVELFNPDGTPANAFACGKCGSVQANCVRQPQHADFDRAAAERCCTCRYCGKETEGYYSHPECERPGREANKNRMLAEATKLESWDGRVWFDDGIDGERVFTSLEALCTRLDIAGLRRPEYVFVCTPSPFKLDCRSILREELDEHFGIEEGLLRGADELAQAVEAFNAINATICTYYPDHKRAVRLPAAVAGP